MTIPDTPILRLVLVFVLIFVNFLLKWKSIGVPIDFDTGNHLYFAFLKSKGVSFKSSYGAGVKYLLPRLYIPLVKFLRDGHWTRFRILNVISSSATIVLWVFLSPRLSLQDILIIFLGVLLINSLWVNYATSATEFHEVAWVMLMVYLSSLLPFPLVWLAQISILLFLTLGFKIVNILYVFPLLLFQRENILSFPLFSFITLVVCLSPILWMRNSLSSSKVYAKTRSRVLFHPKSVKFLKTCFDFISLLVLLFIGNFLFGEIEWKVLSLAIVLILLAQRMYAFYFFYPSIVIGIFIGLQTAWLDRIPVWVLAILLGYVLVFHTARFILGKSGRDQDLVLRTRFTGPSDWKTYLETRDKQVEWMRAHIPSGVSCYLWGSNAPILLLNEILVLPDQYYSHNHLIYWAGHIEAPSVFLERILKKHPAYIIESMIIDDFELPKEQISHLYKQVFSLGDVTIYQNVEN